MTPCFVTPCFRCIARSPRRALPSCSPQVIQRSTHREGGLYYVYPPTRHRLQSINGVSRDDGNAFGVSDALLLYKARGSTTGSLRRFHP